MGNPSSITTPVAFRVPIDVYSIIERRAFKQGMTTGEYARKQLIFHVTRKHGRGVRNA